LGSQAARLIGAVRHPRAATKAEAMFARPARRGSDLRRPAGNAGRLSRDPRELFERHGAAIFGLAMLLLRDRQRAELLTADAILDACSGPAHVAQGADRWELARYVYVRFVRSAGDPATAGRPTSEDVALALGVFGGHTYREIADLLGLAPGEAAELLRSGLRTPLSL
jgi:DNA-directed RNA polymerase specialized sigma24 family protein